MKVDYETTCWNLLQRSLILGSFSDYIHCLYICRDGYNLRTLVVGIKALDSALSGRSPPWASRKRRSD